MGLAGEVYGLRIEQYLKTGGGGDKRAGDEHVSVNFIIELETELIL